MMGGSKRGQLTIFIIVGILIAVALVIVFFLYKSPGAKIDPRSDPQGFIENCVGELLKPAQEKLLPQAGYRTVGKYILFDTNKKVPYLCYTSEEKQICTIIEPMLKNKIEEQLKLETQAGLESCFDKLKLSFANYDYRAEPTDYSIEISPDMLKAKISKKITITQGESAQELSYFEYSEASPLFDFIIITNDILTKETGCDCGHETCSGDVLGISRRNPDYELELFVTSINEKVYTIRDILSNKQYLFSVRNCIRLP